MNNIVKYVKVFNILNPKLWVYIFRVLIYRYSENQDVMKSNIIKKGTVINVTASLRQTERIFLGENVRIGPDCCLWAGKGNITVGNNVILGPRVSFFASNHGTNKGDLIMNQEPVIGDIKIGSDCWFGANSVILSGVTIGDGVVVAAGSVVTKNAPSYSIVGGVPAKVISNRK